MHSIYRYYEYKPLYRPYLPGIQWAEGDAGLTLWTDIWHLLGICEDSSTKTNNPWEINVDLVQKQHHYPYKDVRFGAKLGQVGSNWDK